MITLKIKITPKNLGPEPFVGRQFKYHVHKETIYTIKGITSIIRITDDNQNQFVYGYEDFMKLIDYGDFTWIK